SQNNNSVCLQMFRQDFPTVAGMGYLSEYFFSSVNPVGCNAINAKLKHLLYILFAVDGPDINFVTCFVAFLNKLRANTFVIHVKSIQVVLLNSIKESNIDRLIFS